MGKTDRFWHEQHRMPAGAKMDQRIAWHLEHTKHCGCRPIPKGVAAAMKERGMAVPAPDKPNRSGSCPD